MSLELFEDLLRDLCVVVGLPDPEQMVERRQLQVEGFDVALDYLEDDPAAFYLYFQFGIVAAGRTLAVFRLMLEANLLIYAQDQAQFGMDSDTGGIVLLVRIGLTEEITGDWLANLMVDYAEHGRYWQDQIVQSTDEMFEGISNGDYTWLRV
ncbi:MAG: molecular chaperone Tir [Herminiimonas sp.]|nr:molecular chaperone Tir [Herminiimonas sp.]